MHLVPLLVLQAACGAQAPTPRLARYELDVTLSPEVKRLSVQGTMLLPPAAEARERLELRLSEQMQRLVVDVIEPAASAGRVTLTLAGKDHETSRWQLALPREVPPETPLKLRFSYAGGGKPAPQFVVSPRSSFAFGGATAWYPQLADSRGSGLGLLRFTIPPGQVLLASGERQSTPEEQRAGHFAFALQRRAALSFVAGPYRVVRREGAIPVSVLMYEPGPEMEKYLGGSSRVLELLARWNGPYPYGEFALVEVPNEIAQSAGFSGASLPGFILGASTSFRRPFNIAYFAHEIGHQWWGNEIVVSGTEGRYLLSEGLAQAGALDVIEALEGGPAAETFRRIGYPGYSDQQCALGYFTIAEAGADHRLVDLPREAVSHALVNSKGFLALHALSHAMGPDRFRAALHRVTSDFAETDLTWSQFVERLKAQATRDLSAMLEQWFERTGAPEWSTDWQLDGSSARGVLLQTEPAYDLELDVDLIGDNGRRVTRPVPIQGVRSVLELAAPFPIRRVEVDPRFEILHWTPSLRAEATSLARAFPAGQLREAGNLTAAIAEYRRALEHVPVPDLYGARFLLEYGWAQALMTRNRWKQARTHWLNVLQSPTRRSSRLPWAYLHLAEAAKKEGDLPMARRAAEAAISADALLDGVAGMIAEVKALDPRGRWPAAAAEARQ